MIEVRHLYKTYLGTVHALKDVSFKIDKGEFVYLTGPSGAGKSTLFKILTGMEKATSGQLQVCSTDLSRLSQSQILSFRRRIGVIFQDYKLLQDRTVFDNIALPLILKGESKKELRKKVLEALHIVGLEKNQLDLPIYLSGGEQQRVAIARAIIHKPELIIADEPTGNLDFVRALEITALLELASVRGTTVFIATHDQQLLKRGKHRVIELQSGSLCITSPEVTQ